MKGKFLKKVEIDSDYHFKPDAQIILSSPDHVLEKLFDTQPYHEPRNFFRKLEDSRLG